MNLNEIHVCYITWAKTAKAKTTAKNFMFEVRAGNERGPQILNPAIYPLYMQVQF